MMTSSEWEEHLNGGVEEIEGREIGEKITKNGKGNDDNDEEVEKV